MATSEERLRILKMVEEGKLTPEQGVQLLSALTEAAKDKRGPQQAAGTPPGQAAKFIRIRVTDGRTNRQQVNLRIPIGMVSWLTRAGARFKTNIDGVDQETLSRAIRDNAIGHIVDVTDENGGERVEIILE